MIPEIRKTSLPTLHTRVDHAGTDFTKAPAFLMLKNQLSLDDKQLSALLDEQALTFCDYAYQCFNRASVCPVPDPASSTRRNRHTFYLLYAKRPYMQRKKPLQMEGFFYRLRLSKLLDARLRRRQTGDRNAERRAGNIVQARQQAGNSTEDRSPPCSPQIPSLISGRTFLPFSTAIFIRRRHQPGPGGQTGRTPGSSFQNRFQGCGLRRHADRSSGSGRWYRRRRTRRRSRWR